MRFQDIPGKEEMAEERKKRKYSRCLDNIVFVLDFDCPPGIYILNIVGRKDSTA
jgi:hypothetical protein